MSAPVEEVLLGPPETPAELSPADLRALKRRHHAATGRRGLVFDATPDERWEILRAVVWPSAELVEAVEAIDAGERVNF